MKCVFVADLHGRLPVIPECDVLVIAGDLCPENRFGGIDPDLSALFQRDWLAGEYQEWESGLSVNRIVMTPGNHDWFSRLPDGLKTECYIDQSVDIFGKSFYFSPWIQPIGGWNYELRAPERSERFSHIPSGLDVLVTHSPAFGVLDQTYSKEYAGCRFLKSQVVEKQPRYHVFGHIHEGQRYGRVSTNGKTTSICASMWGPNWTPYVVEF